MRNRAKTMFYDPDTAENCHYCRAPLYPYPGPYQRTIDHVVPLSKGGADSPDNRVLACSQCNGRKGNMSAEEFIERKHRGPPK